MTRARSGAYWAANRYSDEATPPVPTAPLKELPAAAAARFKALRAGLTRLDGVADNIVGDVEKAAHHRAIALDHFGVQRLAAAIGGRTFDHESAFRAHRHNDGIFHHLRLHQPEHLSAEVLASVRPTDAAARDLAAT